jgi:hypothetical protein
MELTVRGEVWLWRGPAPYHFVTVDGDAADHLKAVAPHVSYGWGMIPVSATVGLTTFTTSLWPKDGGYALPLKDAVRVAEDMELGDVVTVRMRVTPRPGAGSRRV